jgi:hypothetical protein
MCPLAERRQRGVIWMVRVLLTCLRPACLMTAAAALAC